MKKMNSLRFLIVLMVVCLTGCAWIESIQNPYSINELLFDLEVDERVYVCSLADHYVKGKYDYTTVTANLYSEEKGKEYWSDKAALAEAINNGEKFTIDMNFATVSTGKGLPFRPDHLQVIDDESYTVLFEIPLEELGVCFVWKDKQFSEEKLKEAMTRVIREKITPQEETTEEQ